MFAQEGLYLLQLYVSCGNSQLSSTQKVCGRWLLSWDSAFSGTYCQCLSILFLISPLSIHHYPFLLDKYCISFIQDESHRYQTPWLASCLPSFLEHLLPCTVARVMRCPLRMPNHSSVFLFRFHPSKSEIKHAAFLRHKTWDRLSVGGFQSCLLAWQLFASRKWDDKDCGFWWLTRAEVQVLLLVVDEFDFVPAILNEERIKLK